MSHFDILVLNEDKEDNNGSSQQQKSMCVRKRGRGCSHCCHTCIYKEYDGAQGCLTLFMWLSSTFKIIIVLV